MFADSGTTNECPAYVEEWDGKGDAKNHCKNCVHTWIFQLCRMLTFQLLWMDEAEIRNAYMVAFHRVVLRCAEHGPGPDTEHFSEANRSVKNGQMRPTENHAPW